MITKEKFKAYLEVQKGGQTNMLDATTVSLLSDDILDKDDVIEIIKNYSKFSQKFNLTMADVEASRKKIVYEVIDG